MSIASATFRRALLAALCATSLGCGSATSPTAPSSMAGTNPIPGGPGPTPGSNSVAAANGGVPGFYRQDVIMSRSGTATVTLQWPNGDFSLQLYVTTGTCLDLSALLNGVCRVLGKTRPGDRPGVVASPVAQEDLTTIWVLNPDPAPQPFTIETKIE